MQLFYAPAFTTPDYTLTEEESKHCVRVLRLNVGDLIHITDGAGNLFCCRIEDAHPKRCRLHVIDQQSNYNRLTYELTIAIAPTKNSDRYEWFLEKSTEIGIHSIVPIVSAHSERKTTKHEREERVVVAAMKQSLKAYLPDLKPLTPFESVVCAPFEGDKFIAHCNPSDSKVPLPHILRRGAATLILIGPEGDFSPAEVELARANGFREISLGSQRLRTETAAMVATTMVATINI